MALIQTRPLSLTEPVSEILHGVKLTDPYRWLEDQNSPRTREWLEQQDAYTRAYLDAISGREQIRQRVEELLAVETVFEPWKVGCHCFYRKRAPYQEQPVIMMRNSRTGEEFVLVDPKDLSGDCSTAVDIAAVSRDAKLLAYTVRHGGEDFYSIRFLDVQTRKLLQDKLPLGLCTGFSFAPDCKGFYYIHRPKASGRSRHRLAVRWHVFGRSSDQDQEIFVAGDHPKVGLGLFSSPDGIVLAYLVFSLEGSRTLDVYLHHLTAGTPPRQIVDKLEGIFNPIHLGKKLIAFTDYHAPNGRIVTIDPDHAQFTHWRDVIPQTDKRIQDYAVVGGLIFVGYVEKGASRIDISNLDGRSQGILACPDRGTCTTASYAPVDTTLFYKFSSFSHAPSIHSYCTRTGKYGIWAQSQARFDPTSIAVDQVEYLSKDGTSVPMWLAVHRNYIGKDSLPTFLTGYGGFGLSLTPKFSAYATFLMEHGCLFAVANLRGGSELGEQWHLAGKRHNRQIAINDFISAAEWLIERGLAARGRIAIGGGSNAGLLVGAALTQRPNLFRAAICLGPILDMLRYHLFDSAEQWEGEYGSATNENDFRHLLAYSPYHRVRVGAKYPAVMFISGDADTRCNPMHVRKMTARLQAATRSEHPILLAYTHTWGHMPAQPLSKRIDALTNRLAFLCHELALNI